MRSCIFVDGENLRHSLRDLFYPQFDPTDYLPKKAKWQEFFDYLASQCYGSDRLRTYWYVVQRIDFYPWGLPVNDPPKLIKLLSRHDPYKLQIQSSPTPEDTARHLAQDLDHERSKMERRFQGWETLQNGIANNHDSIEFRRAGTIPYDLFDRQFRTEKAVDVKLGVDLLLLANIYDVAIIVSGDGDYVPAVQAIKDLGKRVVNVSFKTRGGDLLPGGARSLNIITDQVFTVEYDVMKQYVFP